VKGQVTVKSLKLSYFYKYFVSNDVLSKNLEYISPFPLKY